MKPQEEGRSGEWIDFPSAEASCEALFTRHRTAQAFDARPVEDSTLRRLYDLTKLGPTSGNCSPARFAFVMGAEAKERLRPALSAGNVQRALAAPVVAIVAYDPLFFEALSRLNSIEGVREWFAADISLSEETAFRNGTLQGGYFLLAARVLGLGCLPMSGFDAPMVDDLFLKEKGWRTNFLVALGYPVADGSHAPRAPRLSFDEACVCR